MSRDINEQALIVLGPQLNESPTSCGHFFQALDAISSDYAKKTIRTNLEAFDSEAGFDAPLSGHFIQEKTFGQ